MLLFDGPVFAQTDFNGQSILGKMEIRLEKPILNNFIANGGKN